MADTTTIEEILEFAIGEERAAASLYARLAGEASNDGIRKMFLECAEEERGHERKLVAVQAGRRALEAKEAVADLKIAEYAANPIAIGGDAVEHGCRDQRFSHRRIPAPPRPIPEEVSNRGGEVMVGIHEPAVGGDDAMTVGVGVVAGREVKRGGRTSHEAS